MAEPHRHLGGEGYADRAGVSPRAQSSRRQIHRRARARGKIRRDDPSLSSKSRRRYSLKLASIILRGVLIVAFWLSPTRAASVDEIALYNKPDRQKILVEGAKKEGKISWYTSL